jgi:hypothetical protein
VKDLFSQEPDAPTPLNSAGPPAQGYRNASGDFDLKRELRRKIKSRSNLSQPAFAEEGPMATPGGNEDNATDRYFGAFSIESKRHIWDLLQKHPQFGQKGNMRMGRIHNNTKDVIGGITKTSDRYY